MDSERFFWRFFWRIPADLRFSPRFFRIFQRFRWILEGFRRILNNFWGNPEDSSGFRWIPQGRFQDPFGILKNPLGSQGLAEILTRFIRIPADVAHPWPLWRILQGFSRIFFRDFCPRSGNDGCGRCVVLLCWLPWQRPLSFKDRLLFFELSILRFVRYRLRISMDLFGSLGFLGWFSGIISGIFQDFSGFFRIIWIFYEF